MIRVRDPSLLDYESLKVANFTVVAREIASPGKEGRARVTVHVRDQNDNTPTFTEESYSVDVPEDVAPGETIAWVRATDRDSGLYGSAGVRYTRISGPVAKYLELDSQTGM